MNLAGPYHSPAPSWGVWATLGWLVAAFLLSAIAAIVGYSLWLNGKLPTDSKASDGVIIAIGAIVSVPVQVVVLAFAARLRGWDVPTYLGLTMPRRGEVIVAVAFVIALELVLGLLLLITGNDLVTPFQVDAYRTAREAGALLWFLVAIVIFAPVGEEIAFRGFLYRGLVRPGRELAAIVLIALIWALMHIQYDWVGILQVFAIGLLLGWIRWATGSTTLTIAMHMLINLEAMIETAIKVEYLS
jgi:membrane protease YdiL (CAAX protease family)